MVEETVDRFRIVAQVLVDHVVENLDRIIQVHRWIDHYRLLEIELLLLRIDVADIGSVRAAQAVATDIVVSDANLVLEIVGDHAHDPVEIVRSSSSRLPGTLVDEAVTMKLGCVGLGRVTTWKPAWNSEFASVCDLLEFCAGAGPADDEEQRRLGLVLLQHDIGHPAVEIPEHRRHRAAREHLEEAALGTLGDLRPRQQRGLVCRRRRGDGGGQGADEGIVVDPHSPGLGARGQQQAEQVSAAVTRNERIKLPSFRPQTHRR